MKEVSLKQSMNCSLSSVRPKWQWRNKGGRKSGGVRKANNYYADGGRDGRGRMEEERFGGKYSEQQASERKRPLGSPTYLPTLVVETQRPVRLPACPLGALWLNYLFCQQSGGHGG